MKIIAAAAALAVSASAQALNVSFRAPNSGQTVSGTLQGSSCEVKGAQITSVTFFVDGTQLGTDNGAPWNCTLDTKTLANGMHTLMAVATDRRGNSDTTQVSINVQNVAPPPPPPPAAPSAVPTFESLGIYWKPGTNPGAAGCAVQYRQQGDIEWRDGLALWYDSRNAECRGSLVHLTPDTTYEVQLALPGQPPAATLTAKTWSENFPIGTTYQVGNGAGTLNITQGGTPDGYVLYTGPATLDAANAADFNIVISAPYVIVRGLTLRGARMDAIRLLEGAHDVVIEDNDISEWGRDSGTLSSDGWRVGVNMDSGIKAICSASPWLERSVIQRNRIHHPRYGANSWSDGHPLGPNAVFFHECGGNHVFRHNDVYSDWGRYFMDAYGGADNFSQKGMPNADSDLYGNRISHVWDDGIEAEGANRNVRIWGNYFNQVGAAIATTASSVGPVYVFRNVSNRQRTWSMSTLDTDNRMYMMKSGAPAGYQDGRRYVFHNTMLQAPPPAGTVNPLGGGEGLSAPNEGQPMTNTVSRNNIWHIWKSWWSSVSTLGGSGNDLDHDLVNGNVVAYPGAEPNRIVGIPTYAAGHGWSAEGSGLYQLDPSSLGYDAAVRIPNFNDAYTGAAPDMGAHEAGTAPMRLGVQ